MIIYICDQINKVRSGPGNFTSHLINNCANNNIWLVVISCDKTQSPLVSRPFPRVVTIRLPLLFSSNGIVIALIFSLVYSLLTVLGSHLKIFINGYMYLTFAINLGSARVFVNDSKYKMSRRDTKILKRVLSNCGQVIANSNALNRELKELFPSKSIYTLNKLPNLNFFDDNWRKTVDHKILSSYHSKNFSPIKILFAKHDWRYGNLVSLLQTLDSYNFQFQVHLVIAGIPKSDQEYLSNICKNNSVKIKFYNLVTQKSMQRLYLDSDIFINCSQTEAFGLAAIESSLSGCLLICTERDDGLNDEIRNNKFGIIAHDLIEFCDIVRQYSLYRRELYDKIFECTGNARKSYTVSNFYNSLTALLNTRI